MAPPTVLLVDDARDCQILVRRALGDSVDLRVAADLSQARRMLETEEGIRLLLLDVSLPDGSGFGLCSSVLAGLGESRPRVMFLTGSLGMQEKLTGFAVGADDYVTKPFDPRELRARVLAQLRGGERDTRAAEIVRAGDLRLDLGALSVERVGDDGREAISLTPTEFRMLYALARRPGQVLTREQLISAAGDGGMIDRTVDAHLSRLRRKLKGSKSSIEAVYGVGYRFG